MEVKLKEELKGELKGELKVEELAEIVFLFNLALTVAGEACGKNARRI